MARSRKSQQGIALLTVMAVLVICVLITSADTRSGLLHEMIVGHQSDQLRAQAAAEALVRDAEIDILGLQPDGSPCHEGPQSIGFVGCRQRGQGALPNAPYFPHSTAEFEEVRALVQVGAALPCRDGICFPSSLLALEQLEDALETMTPHGARHGQFTRDAAGAPPAARAWYWIEAFHYDLGADVLAPQRHLQPDPARPFVYRITAVAQGHKPGTRAVVKSVFVPYPSEQMR